MSAALELRSHYKAVRARIWGAAPKPVLTLPKTLYAPLSCIIYAEPIGPEQTARRIYDYPPGPHLPSALSSTTFNRVQRLVSEHARKHNMTVEQMLSDGRGTKVVLVRQELYWTLRRETTWSLPRIGRYLGRDHTTILHGIRQWEKRLRELEAGQ